MISIITPVYNGKKFIANCIQNVIDQNCPEIEHIIMDGGSSDGTVDILKHYSDRYNHIQWRSEKDKGQSDAMNKGIKLAKGTIIGVLNADDYYEPNVLIRVSSLFKNLPVPTLLVGNCNVIDDFEMISLVNKPSDLRIVSLLSDKSPFPYNPSAYFYHKSLHESIGWYEVEEHYAMDIDFLIKAVQAANTHYINETWGNFRHIQGTKTAVHMQSEKHLKNLASIIQKHQRNLPCWKRLQISAFNVLARFKFYAKNPKELPSRMARKLVGNSVSEI